MLPGGRPVKHALHYWLLLAEGHLNQRLFGAVARDGTRLTRPIALLPLMVPHAVLSGRFALEQTFMVSRPDRVLPHQTPIAILEKLCGDALAELTRLPSAVIPNGLSRLSRLSRA